jgi:hypothetical protein
MKRVTFAILTGRILIFATVGIAGVLSLAIAGTVITEFRGEPGFNKVTLKWFSEGENNLKGFEIERGLSDQTFDKIGFVDAKGNSREKKEYVYEDNTVFKTASRTYYYRLKIIDVDGQSTHSQIINVTPTISSARQTWGSIKAMFR